MTAAQVESTCPGCGGHQSQLAWRTSDRLFRTSDKRFCIYQCPECALLFLWPVPAPDELADYYPPGYWTADPEVGARGLHQRATERYRRFMLRDHVRFVRRAIEGVRRHGQAQVDVLDIGCGDGAFLSALGHSPSVGLDFSEGAVRACLSRGLEAHRGSPDRHPFSAPTRRFDIVTMFHFLEHVSSPDTTLGQVRQMLAPGGELIVQVPNCASLQARCLGRHWAGYDPPRHLVNYSTTTLAAALQRSQFELRQISHHSIRDNPTTLANSIAPGLYPPARVAHGAHLNGWPAWIRDIAYLALSTACIPPTFLEAMAGRGAAVTVRAGVKT